MSITERIDARKLNPKELAHLRRLVICLRESGVSNQEVAQMVGLPPQTTSEYYSRWKKEGDDFFKVKRAGRKKRTGSILTPEEERMIIQSLIDYDPRQLEFPFALWTREAVQKLIESKTGKRLALSTVGKYLKAWSFTAKRPIKRAYERNDAKVKAWLKNENKMGSGLEFCIPLR